MKSGRLTKEETAQTSSKPFITNEDVIIAPAVRTAYIGREGMAAKVVAVKEPKRTDFFKRRPQVLALNLRHDVHPIMEEGNFLTSSFRQRKGEFFITPEGMALLAEKVFFEDDKDHSKYNTDNIVFFDNNYAKLSEYLLQLSLEDGEDAKVLFINHAHGIPLYIRNIDGVIHAFLVDSEITHKGYIPYDLIQIIQSSLGDNLNLIVSQSLLQKDAYSCFTFAFHALKHFAKHGAEVFPYLISHGITMQPHSGFYVLPAENLMPELIKLNQSDIKLSDNVLNTVVGKKHPMTLRDYLQKFTIESEGKKVNTAAITKKYKFFDKINTFITSHTNDNINPLNGTSLPMSLQPTVKKFIR